MINADIQRHGNENVAGLMRRFSRKIQGAGVVKKVRALRYYVKPPSETQTKKDALTRIARTEKYRELVKQGREIPNAKKRR